MQLRMARGRTPTLTINGTPLTSATQATAYAGFVVTAAGGSGGYAFSLSPTSGALPSGMTINAATGSPTGTPTVIGSFTNIIIRVTDSFGHTADLAAFSITVAAASPGIVITDPVANNSPYTTKAPVFRDAFVCMTPTVAQDDEALDVQGVCGAPYSPMATSITVSGTDADWFDKISGGKLVFKAATRGSVPRAGYLNLTINALNANGSSEQSTLKVWVPATGNGANGELFVSYATGSSANAGTVAAPFKFCPKTSDWTGGSTYTAGQTIFFEGGLHKTALLQNLWPFWDPPSHHGASTSVPVRYSGTGWRGQAKFTGAKDEAGSWSATTSGEGYNSPALASMTTLTVSTAVEVFQPVYWQDGAVMGRMAQYPRPNNLRKWQRPVEAAYNTNNYNDTTGTSDGGFKRIFYTTNSGDTTAVRLYFNTVGSGASSYIQDAKLDPRFNNASVTYNASGIGMWVMLWSSGNDVAIVNVLGYDVTTHRLTFNCPSLLTNGAYTSYALLNSPYDVQVETQYALSGDGLKVMAYRPASPGQASISRLPVGMGLGTQPNVSYHQMWFQGYSGSENTRAGTNYSAAGGTAIRMHNNSGSRYDGITVYGVRTQNCNNIDEHGLVFQGDGGGGGTTGGIQNFILDRVHTSDNLRGRAFEATCEVVGLTTGSGPGGYPTKAEVAAYGPNKCRWWYTEEDGLSRTVMLVSQMRGIHFKERVMRNFRGVHGDGDAWYPEQTGNYTDHCYVERDFGDCALRWKTTSMRFALLTEGLSNWYDGCVVLGDTDPTSASANVGMALFSGDPGATYTSCIFMQSSNSTDTSNTPCLYLGGGFANCTVQYSVLNGATVSTSAVGGVSPTWTIDHCGNTASLPANDAANSRFVTNITTLSALQKWDGGTMGTGWAAILQAGAGAGATKVGPFSNWTV